MPRPTGAGDGGRAVVLQLVERAISQKRQAEKQAALYTEAVAYWSAVGLRLEHVGAGAEQ